MDQIIAFNKTNEERLSEYEVVFGATKLPSASLTEIRKQWSLYLEIELDVIKWQAFWKIPQCTCKETNITYPTIVLVQVQHIAYEKLAAFVRIVAVQGDTPIACDVEYEASLLHLWPTKQQFDDCDDVVSIANTLDKLRFFYNNIVMAWDYLNTAESGLDVEERLHFHFNLKNFEKRKTVKARTLLKALQNEFIDRRIHFEPDVDLYMKILQLKDEYELLMIDCMTGDQQPNKNKTWLIFQNNCTIKDYIEYLESVKRIGGIACKYETANSLEYALDVAMPNDVIYVNKGTHCINSSGTLKDGITLKGLSDAAIHTTIETNKDNAMIEFMATGTGDKLMIENVHLNVGNARCALITHSGQVHMKNCVISAIGNVNAEHGIIALAGAKVTLEHCKISGFNVGLYASSNSFISLMDCCVFDVSTAVQFFDNSKVVLNDCVFERVSRNCIYFETKGEECKTGDEHILSGNSCITINKCKFEDIPSSVVITNKEDIFNV